jgi:two-component system sensor histidine kinase TtrS
MIGVSSVAGASEDPVPVRIGVLAKRGAERCLEKWGPTAEYLTSAIPGYSFTIVPLGYDQVNPAVERQEVDFVLANSGFYVGLERFYGVSRIVTLKNQCLGKTYTVYGGVIFCRADRDDIKSFADLKGKTFMSLDETAFASWRATCLELKEDGIDPYRDFAELSFGGPMDAVVHAVLDGRVDAGSIRTDLLERMALEGTIRLEDIRVLRNHEGENIPGLLHSTRAYPEWPFAKASHTSDSLAEQVAAALLRMPPDDPAARAARSAGWTIPHNYQPVHECLKALRVGPYEDYGHLTVREAFRQYWPWALAPLAIMVLLFTARQTQINRRLRQAIAVRKRAEEATLAAQQQLLDHQQRERELAEAELDKVREELIRTTRLATIGQVSASIAHDLRNPLGAARNAIYYLRQGRKKNESKTAEYLEIIDAEIGSAERIISKLLEMAKAREPAKQAVDLGQVVDEAFHTMKETRQMRCRKAMCPEPFVVEADPDQLREVVGNLLSNAVDATQGRGEFLVEATRGPDGDTIVFRDTGPGITPEIRQHAFEPLVTDKSRGTGLGLTICREILQRHGGSVEAIDHQQGGAAFRVRLPRE